MSTANSTTAADAEPQLKMLDRLLSDSQIVAWVSIASLTLLIWDYLLTLPDEIQYFWQRSRSIPTCLFFLNRYWSIFVVIIANYGFSFTHSDEFCDVFDNWLAPLIGIIEVAFVQWILMARIYGMYGGQKKIIIPVFTLWCAAFITSAVIAFVENAPVHGSVNQIPGLKLCLPTASPGALWAFIIPLLCYDLTVFVLAANKSLSHLTANTVFESSLGNRLIKTMFKDNLAYFACVILFYLAEALVWKFGKGLIIVIAYCPTDVTLAILGSRMLINLRKEAMKAKSNNQTTLETVLFGVGNSDGTGMELQAYPKSRSRRNRETDFDTTIITTTGEW